MSTSYYFCLLAPDLSLLHVMWPWCKISASLGKNLSLYFRDTILSYIGQKTVQVYTLGRMLHISWCSYAYIMRSIPLQSCDKGLSNKPSCISWTLVVPQIFIKQSKCSKHLNSFLRHCRYIYGIVYLRNTQSSDMSDILLSQHLPMWRPIVALTQVKLLS